MAAHHCQIRPVAQLAIICNRRSDLSDNAGRWRAGSVAVKIINHDRNVGNNFDAMRESVLCSNINHPNVVMTYKASLPASICGAARSTAMR